MAIHFRNPINGYTEQSSSVLSWLWVLFFGPVYFAVRGNWRHFIAHILLAMLTLGLSWLVYPFFIYHINASHFRREGWEELP